MSGYDTINLFHAYGFMCLYASLIAWKRSQVGFCQLSNRESKTEICMYLNKFVCDYLMHAIQCNACRSWRATRWQIPLSRAGDLMGSSKALKPDSLEGSIGAPERMSLPQIVPVRDWELDLDKLQVGYLACVECCRQGC